MVKLSKKVIQDKTKKSDLEKKMMAKAMKVVSKLLINTKAQIIAGITILILFIFSIIGIIGTLHLIFN